MFLMAEGPGGVGLPAFCITSDLLFCAGHRENISDKFCPAKKADNFGLSNLRILFIGGMKTDSKAVGVSSAPGG